MITHQWEGLVKMFSWFLFNWDIHNIKINCHFNYFVLFKNLQVFLHIFHTLTEIYNRFLRECYRNILDNVPTKVEHYKPFCDILIQ